MWIVLPATSLATVCIYTVVTVPRMVLNQISKNASSPSPFVVMEHKKVKAKSANVSSEERN